MTDESKGALLTDKAVRAYIDAMQGAELFTDALHAFLAAQDREALEKVLRDAVIGCGLPRRRADETEADALVRHAAATARTVLDALLPPIASDHGR